MKEISFLITKVVLVVFVALAIKLITPVTFVVAYHTPPVSIPSIRGGIIYHDSISESGRNAPIWNICRLIFNKYLIY